MHQTLALFTLFLERVDCYFRAVARAALVAKCSQEGISVETETGSFVVKRNGKTRYTNTKWIVKWEVQGDEFKATSPKSGLRACACADPQASHLRLVCV